MFIYEAFVISEYGDIPLGMFLNKENAEVTAHNYNKQHGGNMAKVATHPIKDFEEEKYSQNYYDGEK